MRKQEAMDTGKIEGQEHAPQEQALVMLQELTAIRWVWNGSLLAAENSAEFHAAMPDILARLQKLAQAGAISLKEAESGDYEITPLDVKKLESFAAAEIISGFRLLTDLDFSFDEDSDAPENTRSPSIKFKGTLSQSQLTRLLRLLRKQDLNAQMVEIAENEHETTIAIKLGHIRLPWLHHQVKAEEKRIAEEGPEATDALCALSGEAWQWDGRGIELMAEDLEQTYLFQHRELLEEGAVNARIWQVPDETGRLQLHIRVENFDLDQLRAMLQAMEEAATEAAQNDPPLTPPLPQIQASTAIAKGRLAPAPLQEQTQFDPTYYKKMSEAK